MDSLMALLLVQETEKMMVSSMVMTTGLLMDDPMEMPKGALWVIQMANEKGVQTGELMDAQLAALMDCLMDELTDDLMDELSVLH